MQPVWQAQAAALTGKLVSPREGGSRGRDPTGRLGRECRAGCTVLSSGALGTSIPGRASRRGPQDHRTLGTGTQEAPPGLAPGRGPQDPCASRTGIWEGPPGPLHPRDYRAPSEAESCPGGCLSPPAQALVLTQLLCSSSELTEATS